MFIDEDYLVGHATVWAMRQGMADNVGHAFGVWLVAEYEGSELEDIPGHPVSWPRFVEATAESVRCRDCGRGWTPYESISPEWADYWQCVDCFAACSVS